MSDIKRYKERPDAKDFLQILYKQQQSLRHEKQMLERMEQLVSQSIDSIELALSDSDIFEQPELISCSEEYFAVVAVPPIKGASEEDFIDCLQDHVHYCMSSDIGAEFRVNCIILREDFVSGNDQPSFFCSRITGHCSSDRLHIKPEGRYLSVLYKGGIDTSCAYEKLRGYIAEHNLSVCGHAYEYELAGYLSTGDRKDYFCRILVQVEPE